MFDKVGQLFFPQRMRGFLTFRSATIFIICLYAFALLLKLTVKIPTDKLSALQAGQQIFYSRTFLVVYNTAIAIAFYVIYATRRRRELYFRRVVVYAMLLAAVMGEFMDILVPWRL